jgi:hypothetical protein
VSEAEVAWLAGLLEGEGSFMMVNNRVGGKLYRYPKVVVNMTDRDIIDRVATMFGTTTYEMPAPPKVSHKQQWRATVTGVKAAEWMRRLYPWLGERRRARIDEVLVEYGAIESTEVRRQRACREGALRRWRDRKSGQFLAPDPAQPCGAWGCALPAGHNKGRADIPENHQMGAA